MSLRTKITLSFILICGSILRLAAINDPVTYDESYTFIAFASKGVWASITDYSLPNNHIFHSILVFFSTALMGDALCALRLPAFLAGLGMICAAYAFGKSTYSEETGLAGAALVAYMPALIQYSTDARGYSLVGFFTLIVFWLSIRLTSQPSWQDWTLLSLATALGLWTIPLMLYPAGAVYLWLAVMLVWGSAPGIQWRMLLNWFISGLGAGVLTLTLYMPALLVSGWRKIIANNFVQPLKLANYFNEMLPERLISTWERWSGDVPWLLVAILVIGFALSLGIRRDRVPLSLTMLLWVSAYIILRRPDAFDRFWSWMLAPMLVWAAAGLIETARQLQGRMIFSSGGTTSNNGTIPGGLPTSLAGLFPKILVFGSMAWLLAQAAITMPDIPERWAKQSNSQVLAQQFSKGLQPGDKILASFPADAPLWYYLRLYGVPEDVWRPSSNNLSRALVVVAANPPGQTIENVLQKNGFDPKAFNLENASELGRVGKISVFECLPKR
jgi:hypothetical protein